MGNYEQEYARLNTAQIKAVDTIEGPVLVIAGPGTGKTQLLTMRVANILNSTDVNPGNILCLTYTESGQHAMRQRLNGMLGSSAKKVEIHTFHGFGNYLIGRFGEHFKELTGFRSADDLALYEALRTCLEMLPRSNPLSKMAYGKFVFMPDASARISQLKQAGISPEQAQDKASSDSKWCNSVGTKIANAFNEIGRLSPKAIDQIESKLATIYAVDHADIELAETCLTELRSAVLEAKASGKSATLSQFKKQWLINDNGKLYFKAADQIKKIVALAELYGLYETELQKRKLYDYDDMILYALQKLETNSELLAEVQETFQYILADEYQDTNAAQAKIITLIASNGVNEDRPNVMVVGDDDQAIFGFQGALGDVLLHFRERWRGVTTITLKENYRSTQAILDTAREAILTGSNRLENHYQDIDKSLVAKSTPRLTHPAIYAASSPEAVLDYAMATARDKNAQVRLAIIAPKHKYLKALADKLDTAGIDYFYEGREDLLKSPEMKKVIMLADLIVAITERGESQANYIIPEIITMGMLDISRQHAWILALRAKQKQKNWWKIIQAATEKEIVAARNKLLGIIDAVDISDAGKSLSTIARMNNIHGQRLINTLLVHAKTYLGRKEISLNDLLRYTKLCSEAGISLSGKVEKGKADAKVTLLSAHKSKGLEFDSVYVLHADYFTWFREKGRTNILSLPPGWDKIEPRKQTYDDRLRLLYVVMTRAKQELCLIKSTPPTMSSDDDNLPGTASLQIVECAASAVSQNQGSTPQKEHAWQTWYLPKNQNEQIQLKKLLAPSLTKYRLSPSHLTKFLDVTREGPAQLLAHSLLGIPAPVHIEAMFGNLVHQAIRYAQTHLNRTGSLPSNKLLKSFMENSAASMSDERINDAAEVVKGFVENTAIISPGAVSEYSFMNQEINLQGVRLTGIVDHYVNSENSLKVTDFKTGRAINSWHVSEDYYKQKLRRFRQQLLFYCLLFQHSQEFESKSAITLRIAFVEASRRGEYCELTLNPETADLENLQALMQSVWQHIQELNFPNTDTYSQDSQGIVSFENDLITGVI